MTSHAGAKRIVIQTNQRNAWRVRSISGIAYDRNKNLWHVAALESVARKVFETCAADFKFSDEFRAWLDAQTANRVMQQRGDRDNTAQPEIRAADSWSHQARAYNFALSIDNVAMLALGTGTGKTKTAIDIMNNKVPAGGVVIIACPKNVVPVWSEEFAKWGVGPWQIVSLGDGMTGAKKGAAIDAVARDKALTKRTAIVVNYDAIRAKTVFSSLEKMAKANGISAIVFDEIHKCKTHNSQTTMACYELAKRTPIKIGLTGTILYHSPLDCFAQYKILDESIFGKFIGRFKATYCEIEDYGGYPRVVGFKNLGQLRDNLDRIMIEVKREDVLDLPEAIHVNRYCDLEPAAMKAYRSLETKLYTDWQGSEITIANAVTSLIRLQQITGGALPDDTGEMRQVSTAKAELLSEVLDDIDDGEKVLIFAQFTAELAAIRAAVEKSGRDYYELSGRAKDLDAWKAAPGGAVIGMQIQSGAEGISAVAARYCVYYSTGWSLGRYDQSLARVHRPGQERAVTYIHLLANNTIDIKVAQALAARKTTVQAILGRRFDGDEE
jgi:SNF2 family DNA or RNA helicase